MTDPSSTIDIVHPSDFWRKSDPFRQEQCQGRQYARRFNSTKCATDNGFLSKSAWKRKGRLVNPDELPSLVILREGHVDAPEPYQFTIQHLYGDRFVCALDYYEVFSRSQTREKAVSPRKRNAKTTSRSSRKKDEKHQGLRLSPLATNVGCPTSVSPLENGTPSVSHEKVSPHDDVCFYIPENLDSSCDDTNYVFNLLHWGWLHWKADENGFIPLKSAYLHRAIPGWAQFREHLRSAGLIECDDIYIEGEKCFGHRPCKKYWTRAKKVPCKNERLARFIKKEKVTFQPVHTWLEKQFERLEFDMEIAESIIPTIPLPKSESREQCDLRNREIARRCAEGNWHTSLCPFGRFHSNITNMSKELRACLKVDDQHLVAIDLANSQPLIAAIMAIKFFSGKKQRYRLVQKSFSDEKITYATRELASLEKQLASSFPNLSSASNSSIHSSINSITNNHQPQPSLSQQSPSLYTIPGESQVVDCVRDLRHSQSGTRPDLQAYVEACEQGNLYECLMSSGEDRGSFKEKFFAEVFFGRGSRKSQLKNRFSKKFPSIAEMLAIIKKKDYRLSSHLMQHYESTIFIGMVCNRLRSEHPDEPVFTIHDSILCLPDHLATVKKVVSDEFQRFGVRPTLRKEDYRPQ